MMDIRLNISWYTSLKRKALIRRLGHRGVTAIIDLWLYVAQHKPDGNLAGLSDEDIAEAAQFDGEFSEFIKAIGPKPDGLGFLDGDSTQRKVHDWKEHNPWAANAKARSKAAKRAVEVRWRKEREIRDANDPYTDSIQDVGESHIPLSSPSPLPSPPIPIQEDKKSSGKPEPSQQSLDYVKELFHDMKLPQREAGALILDEIERIDGKSITDLMPALRWAVKDAFWCTNFLSCAGLRKRRNGAGDKMKWEKILAKYDNIGREYFG